MSLEATAWRALTIGGFPVMSFFFRVLVADPPPFADIVAASSLPWPVMLHAAGEVEGGWPRPKLTSVPDLSNDASSLEMSPQAAELFAKAGLTGTFIAYIPDRSTRGVEIGRSRRGVTFRV